MRTKPWWGRYYLHHPSTTFLILPFEITLAKYTNARIISKRSISIQKRRQRGVRLAGAGLHLNYDGLREVGVSLHVVVLVVRHKRALVVFVWWSGVPRWLVLQRTRRVLVLVFVRSVLQLLVVRVRFHLWWVRRHHRIVAHTQRWRTTFPVLVRVPRRKHLPIVPVEDGRVRVRSWLCVEARITTAARW